MVVCSGRPSKHTNPNLLGLISNPNNPNNPNLWRGLDYRTSDKKLRLTAWYIDKTHILLSFFPSLDPMDVRKWETLIFVTIFFVGLYACRHWETHRYRGVFWFLAQHRVIRPHYPPSLVSPTHIQEQTPITFLSIPSS